MYLQMVSIGSRLVNEMNMDGIIFAGLCPLDMNIQDLSE